MNKKNFVRVVAFNQIYRIILLVLVLSQGVANNLSVKITQPKC